MTEGGRTARIPARKLAASVAGVFRAGGESFVTEAADGLTLGFHGIEGDVHAGPTRRTGGREPWYPRGTEIRNERQLSIVSPAELGEVAAALGLATLRPEWIGANLALDGIARLSWLPARTLLFFEGGVTLKIDGDNAPCRLAGRAIVEQAGAPPEVQFEFVKAARHRRGLVAWVEKPGTIRPGERLEARLPEQWTYE